jgi:uncharacterized hydrophobic protein (TIGR00271 family)
MLKILEFFRLKDEKEEFAIIIRNIEEGIVFRGTNLWILVFAIFIASLGLNVNSPAVIIGAMLVSPLMGPIIGLGLGMAINDLALLRRALFNYLFAGGVSLATSTLYFLISPLNEAHSEILARTSPNVYDVLIALFGGLAGIIAIVSRKKGNVLSGVAIATALMPPLCTAGYGLATLKFNFFFGSFYLFLINTVFIALATLITARVLKFPLKHLPERKDELKAQRIVLIVVVLTLLPSLYFAYDIVQQNKFQERANNFILSEAIFPNDYLLQKNIDAKNKTITLTYGGQFIEKKEIEALKQKLSKYHLEQTTLEIRQGFAYLDVKKDNEQTSQLKIALSEREKQIHRLQLNADSLNRQALISKQIYLELKAQIPTLSSSIVQQGIMYGDSTQRARWIAIIKSKTRIQKSDRARITQWLKVRLSTNELAIYFDDSMR